MNYTILLPALIGFVTSVGLICTLFLKKETIEEIFRQRIHDEKLGYNTANTKAEPSNLENRLNSLLNKMEEDIATSDNLKRVTKNPDTMKIKLSKAVVSTIRNPYNTMNIVHLLFSIIVIYFVCFSIGTAIGNPVVCLASIVMSVSVPFSLLGFSNLKRKLKVMTGNSRLMAVHLPQYIDSGSFVESLSKCLRNLSSNTLQYKAILRCYNNIEELNMEIPRAIDILLDDLIADKYVQNYFNIVKRAEQVDKEYKKTLSTILKYFDLLIINNNRIVTFAFYVYILLLIAFVGLFVVLIVNKVTMPEVYKYYVAPVGQLVTLLCFLACSVLGIIIVRTSELIVFKSFRHESDPLKEVR